MGPVRFLLLQCFLFLYFAAGTGSVPVNEFEPRNPKSVDSPSEHRKDNIDEMKNINDTRVEDILSKTLLGIEDGEELIFGRLGKWKRSANWFENILKKETPHFHNAHIPRWTVGKHQLGCQSARCKRAELNFKIRSQIADRQLYELQHSKEKVKERIAREVDPENGKMRKRVKRTLPLFGRFSIHFGNFSEDDEPKEKPDVIGSLFMRFPNRRKTIKIIRKWSTLAPHLFMTVTKNIARDEKLPRKSFGYNDITTTEGRISEGLNVYLKDDRERLSTVPREDYVEGKTSQLSIISIVTLPEISIAYRDYEKVVSSGSEIDESSAEFDILSNSNKYNNNSQDDNVEESGLRVNDKSRTEASKAIESLDSEILTKSTTEMDSNFRDSVKIGGYNTTYDDMVEIETLNFTFKSHKQPSRILSNKTSEVTIKSITDVSNNFTNNYKDNERNSSIPFSTISTISFVEKDTTESIGKEDLLNTSMLELLSVKLLSFENEKHSRKQDYKEAESQTEANIRQNDADNFKYRTLNNSALKCIQRATLNILRALQKPDRENIRAELYKIIKDIYSNYNDSEADVFNTSSNFLLYPEIFENLTVGIENKTYDKEDYSTSVMELEKKHVNNISAMLHDTTENIVAVSESFDFTKSETEKTDSNSNDSANQSHHYEEIRTSKYEVSKKPDNALLSDKPYNISNKLYTDHNGSAADATDTSTNLLTIKDITENETLGELDSSSINSGIQTQSHGDIEPNIYTDFRKNKEKNVTHEIITSPASELNITESTSVIYTTWNGKSATELGDSSEIITEEVLSFTDHTNDTIKTDSKNKVTLNIIAFTHAPNLESNTMEVQSNFSDIQNVDVISDSAQLGNNQTSDNIKDKSIITTLKNNDMRNATDYLYLAYTTKKSDSKLSSVAFEKTEEIAQVILPTLTTNRKDSKEDTTILHATPLHLLSTTMSMLLENSQHNNNNNSFFTNETSDIIVDSTKADVTTSSSIITEQIRKENNAITEHIFEVNGETLNNNATNIQDRKDSNENRDILMNMRDHVNPQTVSQSTSILNTFTASQFQEEMFESFEFNHTEKSDQSSGKMTPAFENVPNVLHKGNESEKSNSSKDKLISEKSGEESSKPVNITSTHYSTTYFNSSEDVEYIQKLKESQSLMNESDILINIFSENGTASNISNMTEYTLGKNETGLTESSAISFTNTVTNAYMEKSEILYKNSRKGEVDYVETTINLDNLNKDVASNFNNTSSLTQDYGSNENEKDATLDHVSLYTVKSVDGDEFTARATPATTIGPINAPKFLYYPSINVTTEPPTPTEYQIPYVIKSIPIINNDTGDVYYRTINVTLDKLDYIRRNNLSQYEEYLVYLREYFNQYAGQDDDYDRYKRSAPIPKMTKNFRNYFLRGTLIRRSPPLIYHLFSRSYAGSKIHKSEAPRFGINFHKHYELGEHPKNTLHNYMKPIGPNNRQQENI